MDGESENPDGVTQGRVSPVGEGPFFGYFLWPYKESNPPTAEAFDVAFRLSAVAIDAQQDQELPPEGGSLFFVKPKEK